MRQRGWKPRRTGSAKPIAFAVFFLAQAFVTLLFAGIFRGAPNQPVGAVFLGLLASQLCLIGLLAGVGCSHLPTAVLILVAGFAYGTGQLIFGFDGIFFGICAILCGLPLVANSLLGMLCRDQWASLLGLAQPNCPRARQLRLKDLFALVTIVACLLVTFRALGRLAPEESHSGTVAMAGLFIVTSWLPLLVAFLPAAPLAQHGVGIVAALLLGATFPLLVQSLNIGFYASIMAVTYLSLILSLWLLQVSWQTWGDPSAEMQDPIQPTSGRPEQVA